MNTIEEQILLCHIAIGLLIGFAIILALGTFVYIGYQNDKMMREKAEDARLDEIARKYL